MRKTKEALNTTVHQSQYTSQPERSPVPVGQRVLAESLKSRNKSWGQDRKIDKLMRASLINCAAGIFLMYGLVGCAPVPVEMREVKTAPRSQEQAGHLVFKVSLDEIRTRLEGTEFRWRELNSKHQLYEIYGLDKEDRACEKSKS